MPCPFFPHCFQREVPLVVKVSLKGPATASVTKVITFALYIFYRETERMQNLGRCLQLKFLLLLCSNWASSLLVKYWVFTLETLNTAADNVTSHNFNIWLESQNVQLYLQTPTVVAPVAQSYFASPFLIQVKCRSTKHISTNEEQEVSSLLKSSLLLR